MTETDEPSRNVERLLGHLKEGSLAARLVRAHRTGAAEHGRRPMEDVLEERLRRTREALSVGLTAINCAIEMPACR